MPDEQLGLFEGRSRQESERDRDIRERDRGRQTPEPAPELTPLQEKIIEHLRSTDLAPQPPMPVRSLHNFIYCPRLFYYQWVEKIFVENADTVAGSSIHRHVDKPSRLEDNLAALKLPENAKLRSLKLESASLGLVGVVDMVEGSEDGVEIIDYKKGAARRNALGDMIPKEADAMQVIAHGLLLQEQGMKVAAASIYYAESKRRVPVELNDAAYDLCRQKIAEAKATAISNHCPPPLKDDARCLYCSAYPVCLPNESAYWQEPKEKPPLLERAPMPDGDTGEIIVVQKAGAVVGQRGDQLVVSVDGEESRKFPAKQVRSVYLYGAVQLTSQAAQTCLEENIDVGYFSPAGKFLGLLRGLPASGVDARLGQYRLFGEPGIRLQLAREIVRSKIHNQRVLLMRNGDVPDRILKEMANCRDATEKAADAQQLLGLEGAAAAVYFEHFATMLKRNDGWSFDFNCRNRRPPRDPVNALLSLGYSILSKELTGVCHTVGLDPFLGFFHQPRYGRPALALDLMEEFRPLIVDSVVIGLLNRGELSDSDFINSASGTNLNEHGRRGFWEAYFRRMDTEVSHPEFGYKMSYRRMLEVQARQLWRFLRDEATQYHGFTTR
jgi:CRISPR-associated protein Cas1